MELKRRIALQPVSLPMKKLRVLLADDHAVLRHGLKLLVDGQSDMEVVGEAGDGHAACKQAQELAPDIMVMDISMPELNGAQATERLRVSCPRVKILVLSAYSDEAHVRQLLASGASGYVLKRTVAEELIKALRAVASGGLYLDPAIAGLILSGPTAPTRDHKATGQITAREHEVLLDVARGYSNKEIGERLHLSVKTIEGHKARVMEKLDFKSRAELVRHALQQGWLQDE